MKSMRTITIDIINEKALKLLQGLEQLKLIRLRREKNDENPAIGSDLTKYKGAMSKQTEKEIDQQLNELRTEWN